MLTGSSPWRGFSSGQLLDAVGTRRQAPSIPSTLPYLVQELIAPCLRPQPRDRLRALVLVQRLRTSLAELLGNQLQNAMPRQRSAPRPGSAQIPAAAPRGGAGSQQPQGISPDAALCDEAESFADRLVSLMRLSGTRGKCFYQHLAAHRQSRQ